MTSRPQKLLINGSTGEEEYVDLTDEELADYEERQDAPPPEPPPPPAAEVLVETLATLPDDAPFKDVKKALLKALAPKG